MAHGRSCCTNTHLFFSEGLGCYNGPPVTLKVKPDVQPKFYKARSVPFALKGKVEEELQDLQSRGILSPMNHSPWATPVVPVLKKNGKVKTTNLPSIRSHLWNRTPSLQLTSFWLRCRVGNFFQVRSLKCLHPAASRPSL